MRSAILQQAQVGDVNLISKSEHEVSKMHCFSSNTVMEWHMLYLNKLLLNLILELVVCKDFVHLHYCHLTKLKGLKTTAAHIYCSTMRKLMFQTNELQ